LTHRFESLKKFQEEKVFEQLVQQDFNTIRGDHLSTVLAQVRSMFIEVAHALERQIDLAETEVHEVIGRAQSDMLTAEAAREVFLAVETRKARVRQVARRALEGLRKIASEVAAAERPPLVGEDESVELVIEDQFPLVFGGAGELPLDLGLEEAKEIPLKQEVLPEAPPEAQFLPIVQAEAPIALVPEPLLDERVLSFVEE